MPPKGCPIPSQGLAEKILPFKPNAVFSCLFLVSPRLRVRSSLQIVEAHTLKIATRFALAATTYSIFMFLGPLWRAQDFRVP
jgi:hypothetical protein